MAPARWSEIGAASWSASNRCHLPDLLKQQPNTTRSEKQMAPKCHSSLHLFFKCPRKPAHGRFRRLIHGLNVIRGGCRNVRMSQDLLSGFGVNPERIQNAANTTAKPMPTTPRNRGFVECGHDD